MNIILVDATTYSKPIDKRLYDLKRQYFKIKNIVRYSRLGQHNPPKAKTYSIGLLRIATILNKNGENVRYIELNDLYDMIESAAFIPDIIAFSAVCPTVPLCSEVVADIKPRIPSARFVLGGAQLNVAPQLTKRLFPNFDVYSIGYDIYAAEQIVGRKLNQVVNPYVDFSLLPYKISEYSINTFSTLGCPFACNYCQDGLIPYDPVYDDGNVPFFIKNIPEKSCVHFFDSVLGAGNEKRIIEVCKNVQNTHHDFILSCDFRADLINERIIECMVNAGFKEIRLGAESADDDLLSLNNRTLKNERLLKALQMIRENSDMYISLYSAIGFPGSTHDNIHATISLFSSLLESRMIYEVKNCIFVPYPFDEDRFSEKELVIRNFDWRDYDRQSFPVYDLKELNANEIWELFLLMTERINQSWAKGFSIDFLSLESQPMYGEYIVGNYFL